MLKKKKIVLTALAGSAALLLSAGIVSPPALADGIIIPDPMPRVLPHPRPLSVKYHRVSVTINGAVATTSVDQVFLNDHPFQLEGTYIFPLPERASISRFSMYIDGEEVTAEVMERDKARQIYEDIVRRMKDPGLLEYMGRNLFRVRVFPIPARGEKRIKLTYQETLPSEGGTTRYVYPLDVERFSPRPLEEVTINVDVTSPAPIKGLYSPSHDVDVSLHGKEANCSYEERDVKPERDFVLYVTASPDDVGISLLTYRDPGKQGFFLLSLAPGRFETPGRRLSKDIVFVIDTSGSMKGKMIDQAREALRYCVESLREGDRFNIVRFATAVEAFEDDVVPVDRDSRERAYSFINGLQARGGTDIDGALAKALRGEPSADRPRLIVFLTDGEPTVGETDMARILANVSDANRKGEGSRIFVFGLGFEVNTHLLDRLAEDNRGRADYIRPDEELDEFLTSFIGRVSEPVLTDLDLSFGSIKARDVHPARLPDLFQGGQLLVLGRYEGSGASAVTLEGRAGGRERSFVFEGRFPKETGDEGEFIPRLWASRQIGHLMSEIRLHGESRELKEEIIRLGQKYGLVTPYTSMLVLEDEKMLSHIPPQARSVMAAPEAADAVGGSSGRYNQYLSSEAMKASSGKGSVGASTSIQRLREASVEEGSGLRGVKTVGARTFYLHGGAWVDGAYEATMQTVRVEYLSDAYFRLLAEKPELGQYFALGEQVTVVFEGTAYQVVPGS